MGTANAKTRRQGHVWTALEGAKKSLSLEHSERGEGPWSRGLKGSWLPNMRALLAVVRALACFLSEMRNSWKVFTGHSGCWEIRRHKGRVDKWS